MGLFKDWNITNIDLRKKVRRRITSKNIFYCDAQMPSQKAHVENNNEFIRDIILAEIHYRREKEK